MVPKLALTLADLFHAKLDVSQSTHLELTKCIVRRVYAPERPTRLEDLDRLIES